MFDLLVSLSNHSPLDPVLCCAFLLIVAFIVWLALAGTTWYVRWLGIRPLEDGNYEERE